MSQEPFSVRHGHRPSGEPVPFDDVPSWVRENYLTLLREFAQQRENTREAGAFAWVLYERFRPLVQRVLNEQPPRETIGNALLSPLQTPLRRAMIGDPWTNHLRRVIEECEWWCFYDICELVALVATQQFGPKLAQKLQSEVNSLFSSEGLQWQLVDGLVVKRLAEPIAAAIDKARSLLTDARFGGPDEQFGKALAHLSDRPKPDVENCIKDALGAVEGVAVVLSGAKTTLSKLLNGEPYRSGIHPVLSQALQKAYAYRGDAPGVGHALIGDKRVEEEEAEWILTVSAATIVFLVGKFG